MAGINSENQPSISHSIILKKPPAEAVADLKTAGNPVHYIQLNHEEIPRFNNVLPSNPISSLLREKSEMENSIATPSPSSFRCNGEEAESENICSLMETKWYGNPNRSSSPSPSPSPSPSSSPSSSSSSLSSTCKAQELHESLALDSSDTVLLTSLFGLLDRNRDGRVSVDEFQCLLQKLTIPDRPSDDRLTSLIRSIRPDSAEATDLDLDLAQFKAFYHSLFHQEAVEEEEPNIEETLTRAKTQDRPETLTLEEEEDVMEAFKVYDRDGDGFISAWELAIVLQDLDLLPSSNHAVDTCRQLIGRVDGDGNGMVDIHEFKTMLSIGTS